VREDWPLEPRPDLRGGYTQSKLEAEQIVTAAVRERGLPAVILRPGQVFGPGGEPITGAVAQRLRGRLVVLGNGRIPLPLIHVDDVIDALLAAGQGGIRDGSVFHLVDSARLTQEELLDRYREAAPSVRCGRIPLPMVYVMAAGVQVLCKLLGRSAPISIYRVRSARAPLDVDCSAARQRLGWTPRVGVENGLRSLWSKHSEATVQS
jgi:nucleoside-diphosphate-sugar epimerase